MTVLTIYLANTAEQTKLKVVTDDSGTHLLDGPAGIDAAEVRKDVEDGEFEFLNHFPASLMASAPEEVAEFDKKFPDAELAYAAA